MSIQQGTIAAKIVGLNQTKNGLSNVLEQWGEEVPQTFGAYPNAFNNVFENLDEKIDAVSASLSDYLPLSGGTVDKLSVDSPEFYVRNLLSVNVENDKMGGLMLGSNILNITPPVVDGDKQCAPILIGNDLQSPDGVPMPSIAVGNNAIVRYGGIAIGGATGMSYEYDFGIGSEDAEAVHIINPLRRDVVLSTLQFVDENGDTATSALYASDRITIVGSAGLPITFTVHQTTGKWGRTVPKQVGRRIVYVWEDADDSVVLAQQSVAYYSHYTPQYLKLKFDPEEINSVDMGAAELFSIAIGNNTMAGAYLSSDGSYQQSPFAGAIAIGAGSIAKDKGTVVIGSNSVAQGSKSIAFGFNAFTSADNAIQFGTGTNDTPRSFQINDVNIVKDNYDSSLSSWTGYKLNPDLLPDGTVLSNDLSAYLPLTGGTISSDTFKWLMSNGSSNMLSVDPVGGNYALGNSSEAGPYLALAIGTNAHATGGAVAIGGLNAWATADNSIQIGQGTNNTAGTTQIKNWQLLDTNGNIPEARLSSVGYAKASSIPTVNNGTLTIQKNGSTVQTFSANQSTAVTANIAVPTKTSELTNDSNFLTAHQDLTDYAKKNDLSNYLPLSGGYETGIISSDFSCVSAHIHFDENDEEGSTNWIEADILMYSPLTAAQNTTRKKYKISINNVTTGGSPEVNIPTNGTYDLEYSPSEQMPSYNSGTWLVDYENDGQSGFTFYIAANDAWDPYYSNINKRTWTQCSIPSYLATAASIDDYVKANTEDFLNWRNKRRIELGESAMSPTLSANVNNDTGIAIGYGARTYKNASNYTDRSIAIGCNARANTTGTNVYDSGIALGYYAYAGTQGICIGNHQSNYSNGTKSISIGGRQAHTGNNSVQIGWEDTAAYANYTEGVFIGNLVQGRNSSTVIGYGASTTQANNVAVGREAYANGIRSVSLGYQAQGTQADEVCVGYMAKATTSKAMQFGQGTNATTNTVQFRDKTVLSGDNMTVVKERLPDGIVFVDDLSEALSGYVDLSSNQTVGGDKHFTGKTTFESEYGADGDDHAYPRFQGANPAIEVNGGSDYAQLFTSELDLANSDGSYTSYAKDKIAKYDANFLETAFYLPSVAGNLVVNGQVNTAIGTINTNFTAIAAMIANKPTDTVLTASVGSRASGWTFSSDGSTADNKVKIYHWGQMAAIMGSGRKSSAITANTAETSLGTITMPSGYSILAAFIGSAGVGEIWAVNSSGVLSIRHFSAKNANTWIGFRIIVMLNNIGDRYSRTNVATI